MDTFNKHFAKELFAERLRVTATKSEELVRNALITKGYQFTFQEIVFGYIPDFHFPQQKKIVELDGKCHRNQRMYDKTRDGHLRAKGYKILRIRSKAVFEDLSKVLGMIEQFVYGIPIKKSKKYLKLQKDRAKRKHPSRQLINEAPF